MTAKEKRVELVLEAEELGLNFAKNISTQNLEDKIRTHKDHLILEDHNLEDDEIDEDLVDDEDYDHDVVGDSVEEDTDEEVVEAKDTDNVGVVDVETAIRLKLEKEFEKRLADKAAEIRASFELNAQTDTRVGNQGLLKLKAKQKAEKLIRCIITNRNPLKQSWEGEIIAVSNDLIGMQRKFVPFSLEEGYHLPQIIVDTLKDKECTVFVNSKTKNGEKVKIGKLIKEYAIEILPPLTAKELEELGRQQAARGSIDND